MQHQKKMKIVELPTEALIQQKPMVQPWFDEKGKRQKGPKPQKKTP